VIVNQVDMDTALTAYLLGVSADDEIIAVRGEATAEDLADPNTLCIEAGGSGQVHLGNFDHHNIDLPLPPACRQALNFIAFRSFEMGRLVSYVERIDRGDNLGQAAAGFPSLSALFSGMRLSIPDPCGQLMAGIAIFRTADEEDIDPFGVMPPREEWREWVERKREENNRLAAAMQQVMLFRSKAGRRVALLESNVIGGPGALYRLGCEVGITYSPAFGAPPVAKFTIGSNVIRVDCLLPYLNALEEGWGGPSHGTIIASPRGGSRLTREQVIETVMEHL
jgi:hypothetical protein